MFNRIKIMMSDLIRNFVMNVLASGILVPKTVRRFVFKLAGMRMAPSALIFSRCFFRSSLLIMEPESIIQQNCYIDNMEKVTIKKNAVIGHNCKILTVDHNIEKASRRCGYIVLKPVEIGVGAWVGANSTILPGVKIGDGSIVAAGSVVTKNIPPNELWGGAPAKLIRELRED